MRESDLFYLMRIDGASYREREWSASQEQIETSIRQHDSDIAKSRNRDSWFRLDIQRGKTRIRPGSLLMKRSLLNFVQVTLGWICQMMNI